MEKRVRFKSAWLPWLLVAPQMAVVLVFFFWPAGQALYQSVLQEDAFGTSREFVGMANFQRLWDDSSYLNSFKITLIFSALVSVVGISVALDGNISLSTGMQRDQGRSTYTADASRSAPSAARAACG